MDGPSSTPVVSAIRQAKRGRQRVVELSDGREFVFSDEACERAGLTVGSPASDEVLEGLDRAEERVNLHEAALRLLSVRPRSENEMRTRLGMRGYSEAAVSAEIERLRASQLLDDTKFATAWVEERKRLAPRGRRMLRYELLGRGIDPAFAEAATDGLDDSATALDLARQRLRKSPTPDFESFAARTGGFLQRRGFDYQVTAAALRAAWAERVDAEAEGAAPSIAEE